MKLIVGLGNPGKQYEHTRHNLGFMVVEHLLKALESVEKTVWTDDTKLKSDSAQLTWNGEKIILAKPKTFMNNSGMAVQLISSYYKIAPEDVWVVYDEFDLPLGSMKIRLGGAAAGHHGVESVIEQLGTDKFWRFRLGIGIGSHHAGAPVREEGKRETLSRQDFGDVSDYVLDNFGVSEQGKVRELIKHGADALQLALEKGMTEAMNRYNTK